MSVMQFKIFKFMCNRKPFHAKIQLPSTRAAVRSVYLFVKTLIEWMADKPLTLCRPNLAQRILVVSCAALKKMIQEGNKFK